MRVLNLGGGTKLGASCTTIDWSPYYRLRRIPGAASIAPIVLDSSRLATFKKLPREDIICHDLTRGIPFPDSSFDVVYHSHFIPHISRSLVPSLFSEIYRVLAAGGHHRLVVPDLAAMAKAYLNSYARASVDPPYAYTHESAISGLIELMVRSECYGTSKQRPLRRYIENVLLGDAQVRGETYRWMYDQVTMTSLLSHAGFLNVHRCGFNESEIDGWKECQLETNEMGHEYKPGSLYMEARKL